jgi:riboflavin synthase
MGVAIIPHTYERTTLGVRRPGDRLNLECDIIAKHVEKLLETRERAPAGRLTIERLSDEGF